MTESIAENTSSVNIDEIVEHCKEYKGGETGKSVFQLVTTLPLFFLLLAVMYASLGVSYWLTLLLAVPAAGLLTRVFIFQHDCGHGSFFPTKEANDRVGRFMSLLTFTPYDFWRRAHNMHHATSGDLDRRSIGAIDTVTTEEFQAMSKWKKIAYRIYRHPFVLLIFGTPFYVIVAQRIPFNQPTHFYENYKTLTPASIRKSIMQSNLALLCVYGVLGFALGFYNLFLVYFPVLVMTSWIGGWLFYIQHQFEETYWERNESWNVHEAALMGSSYYHLPKVIQWFTGNIGLHHIHHLCSQIPNYKLQECMDARPELAGINKIGFWQSLKSLDLKLWNVEQKRLVSYKEAWGL